MSISPRAVVAWWAGWAAGLVLAPTLACTVRGLIGSNVTDTDAIETNEPIPGTGAGAGTGTSTTTEGETRDTERLDLSLPDVPAACVPLDWRACDDDGDDLWQAIGLACESDGANDIASPITSSIDGDRLATGVHRGRLGMTDAYLPREGEAMVVLSTGKAAHLRLSPSLIRALDPEACPTPSKCPSTVFSEERRTVLPPPIEVRNVARGQDCFDDPTLVGQGDCSNTLQEQWSRGQGAVDYVEMRFRAVVPERIDGLTYQFAFFSSEYPVWAAHDNAWNDMYLAWLESETWTGNISFDEEGNPITVNSVLFDYLAGDDPDVCETLPELQGFAMQCHGGTKWLRTTAPVVPGETIELVFALFDMTDGEFDSFVLLDGFRWTCFGATPQTVVG